MRMDRDFRGLAAIVAARAGELYVVPLATLAIFAVVIVQGASRLSGGFDGSRGLNVLFGLLFTV